MLKRAFDFCAAAAGLAVLALPMLVVAILIKLDSPGPVFYRQRRVGRHGKVFRIFKFRTMTDAPSRGGAELTVAGDARITRVGAVLRRTKIDELAQLIDVLRGTMSLVGPRPEVPRYVEKYPSAQRERVLSVRPGITDFASLQFRDENELLANVADPEHEYLHVILPEKLRVAVNYVDHASLSNDLRVLGMTLRAVIAPNLSPNRMIKTMGTQEFWRRIEGRMSKVHGRRPMLSIVGDAVIVLAAWHVTYLFRLGFEGWSPRRIWYDDYVSWGVVVMYLLCLQGFSARLSMWRFFAFDDFRRIVWACAVAGLVSAVLIMLFQLTGVARAVLVLHPVFALLGLSLARMSYRMLWEHARAVAMGDADEHRYVIVMGAGDVARRLIAGLQQHHGWHLLMLLDDDPALHGMRIAGVPVEGSLDRIRDPGLTHAATHVILALEGVDEAARQAALDKACKSGLIVLTIPGPDKFEVNPVAPGGVLPTL